MIPRAVQPAPSHDCSGIIFSAHRHAQVKKTAFHIPPVISAHIGNCFPRLCVRERMMISGPGPCDFCQVFLRNVMKDQVFQLIIRHVIHPFILPLFCIRHIVHTGSSFLRISRSFSNLGIYLHSFSIVPYLAAGFIPSFYQTR